MLCQLALAGGDRGVAAMRAVVRAGVVAALLVLASAAQAQMSDKVNLEAAEMVAELIGAPVFAADGSEIGEVADISFDEEGRPQRLRMKTAAILGIGERTLDIPDGAFIALRGAVVLDFPTEAVRSLPDAARRDGAR